MSAHEKARDAPRPTEPLRRGQHWYEVWGVSGHTLGYVQARSRLEAEVRAEHAFGTEWRDVAYTEL